MKKKNIIITTATIRIRVGTTTTRTGPYKVTAK